MGFLTEGRPLEWEEMTSDLCDYIREHGVRQFLAQYHKTEAEPVRQELKWGDEVEYTLVNMEEVGPVNLTLRGSEVIHTLQQTTPQAANITWHPEFARWMLEGTPGMPYGNLTTDLLEVERNMATRRQAAVPCLLPTERLLSITSHPRMGQPDALHNPDDHPLEGDVMQSLFLPDVSANPHPRFPTLMSNIRKRRGAKVDIRTPLYMDTHTDPNVAKAPHSHPDDPPHIYTDCMAFGMGTSCLQVTFQATDLSEARFLYDQLAVMGPLMLALTAATPAYRGYLADTDARWNQIVQSVDDRTAAEQGDQGTRNVEGKPLNGGQYTIPKSRYASVSRYVSEKALNKEEYNDIDIPCHEPTYNKLRDAGIDDALARHVAYIFVRDPLVVYQDKIVLDDDNNVDHFENLNSTNWNSMRLKLPPPNSGMGWRVEFRTMEVQWTDFENAAFVMFIVLLSRIILTFELDFYIPLSQVDANMERAHKRNSVVQEKFMFRRHICQERTKAKSALLEGLCGCSSATHDYSKVESFTLNEIFNGRKGKFPGLVPLIHNYLDLLHFRGEARHQLNGYLEFVAGRASGAYQTPATFMRTFFRTHVTYQHDSVVTPEATADLLRLVDKVTKGEVLLPEMYGDLWPRANTDPRAVPPALPESTPVKLTSSPVVYHSPQLRSRIRSAEEKRRRRRSL